MRLAHAFRACGAADGNENDSSLAARAGTATGPLSFVKKP